MVDRGYILFAKEFIYNPNMQRSLSNLSFEPGAIFPLLNVARGEEFTSEIKSQRMPERNVLKGKMRFKCFKR